QPEVRSPVRALPRRIPNRHRPECGPRSRRAVPPEPVWPPLLPRRARSVAVSLTVVWPLSTDPRTSSHLRMMIDRTRAAAQSGIGLNRLVNKPLRVVHCFRQSKSASEAGGDGGRIGTAGSVRVACADPRRGELAPLRAIEENIGAVALQMSALDQHGTRAQF